MLSSAGCSSVAKIVAHLGTPTLKKVREKKRETTGMGRISANFAEIMKRFPLPHLRYIVAGLSLVGAGIMAYLVYLHYAEGGGAVCDISAELSCSVVNKSEFSEILGVPISVLGLLYFLAIAAMMLYKRWSHPFREATLATVFSLSFSS